MLRQIDIVAIKTAAILYASNENLVFSVMVVSVVVVLCMIRFHYVDKPVGYKW